MTREQFDSEMQAIGVTTNQFMWIGNETMFSLKPHWMFDGTISPPLGEDRNICTTARIESERDARRAVADEIKAFVAKKRGIGV